MEATLTDPIASSAAAAAAGAASDTQAIPELGRDDFLRLLVAKLENQNPLEPAKDEEFVAQLATFSSLEQLINVNEKLEGLTASQGELLNSQAFNMIGKEALVDSGRALRVKDGVPDTLVYSIPRPARSVTLDVLDSQGEVVRSFSLDTRPNGPVTVPWEAIKGDKVAGERKNGSESKQLPEAGGGERAGSSTSLPDGNYQLRVNAIDLDGDPMEIGLFRSLPIDGVSFEEGGIQLISKDLAIPFELILEIRAGQS